MISGFDDALPALVLSLLVGLGLLGGIGMGVKAVLERRALNATASATQAKAGSEDATAASIVAAAARELIDPLRKELATERAENAQDVERERVKVRMLQKELDQAMRDVASLRAMLRRALSELEKAKGKVLEKDEEIAQYEMLIAQLKAAYPHHEDDDLAKGPDTP